MVIHIQEDLAEQQSLRCWSRISPAADWGTDEFSEKMNDYMNQHIHYVARGGIASFAISALDIAFWDIELKSHGIALKDLRGKGADKVRTYYGGIDLMYSEKELLENIENSWLPVIQP